jgi:hypothetical protein
MPIFIASMIACGDDNPASSDKNGGGNGADVTAPAVVTDLFARSPTTTSIALVWTAPGDDGDTGTASQYDLRFSTMPITDQNWDTAIPVDGEPLPKPAGEIETFRVMNLESAKEYHFALKTSDEVPNVSGLSNVAFDSTEQETTPPVAVADLSAEGIADGSFRLTWTAPGDDGSVGDASEYDIRYSTSPVLEQSWDSATQVDGENTPKPAGSPDTMLVSGLEAGTNYFFAMKTADEVPNWSEISNLCPALANGNNLWAFPERVKEGNNLTIVYRTPETGTSKLHAHFRNEVDQWARLAIEWERPPGVHTMEWDFKRGGEYHSNPYNVYTLKLYWNSVVVAETMVWLDR